MTSQVLVHVAFLFQVIMLQTCPQSMSQRRLHFSFSQQVVVCFFFFLRIFLLFPFSLIWCLTFKSWPPNPGEWLRFNMSSEPCRHGSITRHHPRRRMRSGAVSQILLSTIHLRLTYLFKHPAIPPVTCPSECPLSKSLTVASIKRSTQREVFMNWADNILQT